jgi:hypothetical protein
MGMLAFGIDRNRILPRWCVRGTVQNMRIARGRFGLLTYHDVLEHILDPADELRSARKFMGEDGFLIVDVPDVSVDQGQHHWKAEHVWYFNFEALRSLFHGAGFDVVGEDRPIPGKLVLYGAAA